MSQNDFDRPSMAISVARKTLHRSVGWTLVRTFLLKITQVVPSKMRSGVRNLNINRILVFIVLTTILNVYWTQGIHSATCQSNNCFKHSVLPSTEVGGRGIFEREFIFLTKWFTVLVSPLSLCCHLYIMQRWWHIMQGWMNSFMWGWIRRPQFFPPVTFFPSLSFYSVLYN